MAAKKKSATRDPNRNTQHNESRTHEVDVAKLIISPYF